MENYTDNLKLCKVMAMKQIEDIKVFNVLSVECCIDTQKGYVEMLTGIYAGKKLPVYNNKNINDDYICVDVHDIKDVKRIILFNDLDQLRACLEEIFYDRKFVLNNNNGELESINFIYDQSQEKIEPSKNLTNTKIEKQKNVSKINKEIKKSIIGQDQAIKTIVAVACGNQRIIDSNCTLEEKNHLKKNMLIVGKSGTGKTEIIKQLAKHLDVPYIIEDATRYTKAGYVGESVEDMLKNLVRKADGDIELAQRGILVVDEIDKLRNNSERSGDVGTYDVQVALLKIIEGGSFTLKLGQDEPPFTFDTSLLTVIVSGAFMGMFEDRETVTRPLGFNTEEPIKETKVFEPEDFIKYGMAPELMGRIPTIVMMNDLTKENYKEIIKKSKLSPLLLEKMNLKLNNVSLKVQESFIDYVAEEAMKLGIGARGIRTVFYKLLGDLDFEVLKGDLKQVNLTEDKVIRVRKDNKKVKTIEK